MEETPNHLNVIEENPRSKKKMGPIGPKHVVIATILILVFIGTVVGIINYRQSQTENEKITIEVNNPHDNQTITGANTILDGKTTPGAKITVDGEEVLVDSKGNFSTLLTLKEGKNNINITAEKNGKKAEKTLILTRSAVASKPKTKTTATPSKKVKTASKKLSSAGPETFFIPEITLLSGTGAAWYASRKKLKESQGR